MKRPFLNTHVQLLATLTIIMLAAVGCSEEAAVEEETETVVEHRRSPIVISALNHDDTYIKVVYGQPYKRGREIFGGLEPFGEVWRTGANEATEITLTDDIQMAGYTVEEGTYSLFTIPETEEWTVILNTQLGQWGAFSYNPDYDYLRFQIPAEETEEIVEALTITLEEVTGQSSSMSIAWDDTHINIPIEF
ncbi:MAG: DUF2911 domain-containing protein [Balneolaceae bacterium]